MRTREDELARTRNNEVVGTREDELVRTRKNEVVGT